MDMTIGDIGTREASVSAGGIVVTLAAVAKAAGVGSSTTAIFDLCCCA